MCTIYTPKGKIYSPDHPFMEEGNIALRAIRLKKQSSTKQEESIIGEEMSKLTKRHVTSIYCDSCSGVFPSSVTYEIHYEAIHRNVCSECDKIFPGSMWLRLHQDEFHDIFKRIQKERGEKIYKCYVESCTRHFRTPSLRKLHLIEKHKYPSYFPFDLPMTGSLSIEKRRYIQQRNMNHSKKPCKKEEVDPMDVVVEQFSKLHLPKSISFGRRSTPSLPNQYNLRSRKTDNKMQE